MRPSALKVHWFPRKAGAQRDDRTCPRCLQPRHRPAARDALGSPAAATRAAVGQVVPAPRGLVSAMAPHAGRRASSGHSASLRAFSAQARFPAPTPPWDIRQAGRPGTSAGCARNDAGLQHRYLPARARPRLTLPGLPPRRHWVARSGAHGWMVRLNCWVVALLPVPSVTFMVNVKVPPAVEGRPAGCCCHWGIGRRQRQTGRERPGCH